jgi:hypothetical protein
MADDHASGKAPVDRPFDDCVLVQRFANAEFFASQLFRECFAADFPVPRENAGLPISTPPEKWRQYVAFYKWPDERIEAVGFCNWLLYEEAYLVGGMCVSPTFYRRIPRVHFAMCRDRGGVAQMLLETGFRELTDCSAWFGFVGDRKARIVDLRAGFTPTRHELLLARWQPWLSAAERNRLEDKVAAIGPF